MTRIIRRKIHWPSVLFTVGGLAILTGVGILVLSRVSGQNPIPSTISRQIHYPVFLPTIGVDINTSSYKFDQAQKVLSFTGRVTADGQTVTFAEQATPDPFNDIPGYYGQFLAKIYEYSAFDSLQGTVNLTHPQGAGQAAVMNAKGTLLFARVATDESKSTWQQIFDRLVIYNP